MHSHRLIPTLVLACSLALPTLNAQEDAKENPLARQALKTTRTFIQGVRAEDEERIKESFDFKQAHQAINGMLQGLNISDGWNKRENTRTLIYHFTKETYRSALAELLRDNVDIAIMTNQKYGLAKVIFKKQNVKPNDEFPETVVVKLKKRDDGWRIVTFQDLWPVDPWEILTGGEPNH